MKKTLVAAAVLASVGAVSAQSSVTLYGRLDTAVGVVKLTNNAAFGGASVDKGIEVFSGARTGSRWGMRGREDLGGGMAAVFSLEGAISLDDGATAPAALFGREAFVGLSGGFGDLTIGRQYTPYDGVFAFTGGYAVEAWQNPTATAFGNPNSINTNRARQNNSVRYATPVMGGFSGTLMWAPGEDKNAVLGTGRYVGMGLGFASGPVALRFAYETHKTITPATTFVLNATTGVITPPVAAVVGATVNQWVVGASYDLGVAKLMGTVQRASQGAVDDKGYALGLSAPLGPVTLVFEYGNEKTTGAGGAFLSKASAMHVRADYSLSKRTMLYALVADGTASRAAAPGGKRDISRYQVGLSHNF